VGYQDIYKPGSKQSTGNHITNDISETSPTSDKAKNYKEWGIALLVGAVIGFFFSVWFGLFVLAVAIIVFVVARRPKKNSSKQQSAAEPTDWDARFANVQDGQSKADTPTPIPKKTNKNHTALKAHYSNKKIAPKIKQEEALEGGFAESALSFRADNASDNQFQSWLTDLEKAKRMAIDDSDYEGSNEILWKIYEEGYDYPAVFDRLEKNYRKQKDLSSELKALTLHLSSIPDKGSKKAITVKERITKVESLLNK